MYDALQLLVNQGEIFASCGCIYLQPAHVTALLKPLVDHRLGRDWAIPRAFEHTGELFEESPGVKLLLSAVDVLCDSGEMREELLPMLWEDVDLEVNDYAAVLLMLSESGVLFLSEHTSLGRRWVMPMRLPEATPPALTATWDSLPPGNHLTLTYKLRIAPPGLVERLMASCYGLGFYHQFWRRGALIRARAVPEGAMLLELCSAADAPLPLMMHAVSDHAAEGEEAEPPPPDSDPPLHLLMCELRGPSDAADELAELLVQVRLRADRLLRDFPGLGDIEGVVSGQGASSLPTASAVSGGLTTENLALADEALPPPALTAGVGAVASSGGGVATGAAAMVPYAHATTHSKYLGQLKFGRPIESFGGLHRILGVGEPEDLRWLRLRGEEEIDKEVRALRGPLARLKDAMGWADGDWLEYVRSQAADERRLPVGMPAATLDAGHKGMRLSDFCRHPQAVAAGLKRAHVLALRLYSCSVYRTINACLRHGCSLEAPHPYTACVALLVEAVGLLRAARPQHSAAVAAAAAAGVPEREPGDEAEESNVAAGSRPAEGKTLWHGVAGMSLSAEFLVRGGTSMGLLSASPDRSVAERYATRESGSRSSGLAGAPLLLRLSLPDAAKHGGAPIAFLSCYPHEREVVYGPGTYLRPAGRPQTLVCTAVRAAACGAVHISLSVFRVLEVVPLPRTEVD